MANSTAISGVQIIEASGRPYGVGAVLQAVVSPDYAQVKYTWARLTENYPGAGYGKDSNGINTYTQEVLSETSNEYTVTFNDVGHAIAVAVEGQGSFVGVRNTYVKIPKPTLVNNSNAVLVVPENGEGQIPQTRNFEVTDNSDVRLRIVFKDVDGTNQGGYGRANLWASLTAEEYALFPRFDFYLQNNIVYINTDSPGAIGYPKPVWEEWPTVQGDSPWNEGTFPYNKLNQYVIGFFYGRSYVNGVSIPDSSSYFSKGIVPSGNYGVLYARLEQTYNVYVENVSFGEHAGDLFANVLPRVTCTPSLDYSRLTYTWYKDVQSKDNLPDDAIVPTANGAYITPDAGNHTYLCVVSTVYGYTFKGTIVSNIYNSQATPSLQNILIQNSDTGEAFLPDETYIVEDDKVHLSIVTNPADIQCGWAWTCDYVPISGATLQDLFPQQLNYEYAKQYAEDNPNLANLGSLLIGAHATPNRGSWDYTDPNTKNAYIETKWAINSLVYYDEYDVPYTSGQIPWGHEINVVAYVSKTKNSGTEVPKPTTGVSFVIHIEGGNQEGKADGYWTAKEDFQRNIYASAIVTNNSAFLAPSVFTGPKVRIIERDINEECDGEFESNQLGLGDVATIYIEEAGGIDDPKFGQDYTVAWYREYDDSNIVLIGSDSNTYTIVQQDVGHVIIAEVRGVNAYKGVLRIESNVILPESQGVKLGKCVVNGDKKYIDGQLQNTDYLFYTENIHNTYVPSETSDAKVTVWDEDDNVVYSLGNNHGIADNTANVDSFRFQWCKMSANELNMDRATDISGATDSTFKVRKVDVGYRIGVKVTGLSPNFTGTVSDYLTNPVETRVVRGAIFRGTRVISFKKSDFVKRCLVLWDNAHVDNPDPKGREEYENKLWSMNEDEIRAEAKKMKWKNEDISAKNIPAVAVPNGE